MASANDKPVSAYKSFPSVPWPAKCFAIGSDRFHPKIDVDMFKGWTTSPALTQAIKPLFFFFWVSVWIMQRPSFKKSWMVSLDFMSAALSTLFPWFRLQSLKVSANETNCTPLTVQSFFGGERAQVCVNSSSWYSFQSSRLNLFKINFVVFSSQLFYTVKKKISSLS